MHSLKSYYYHLKAGVHLICNVNATGLSFTGDILGTLSWGAIKIQLWHGVGLKACGKMRNTTYISKNSWIKKMLKKISVGLSSPGNWFNYFFLVTSAENERVILQDRELPQQNLIKALYPRLCPCICLTQAEKKWIQQLQNLKKQGKKIILYLPTFREISKHFVIPSQILGFEQFLSEHHIAWIEKKHRADSEMSSTEAVSYLQLPKEFDVNVLYPYIDMLITDYSSASSDAIFWNKLTVEYCPDYNDYKDQDRGFVAPWDQYHVTALPVIQPSQLFEQILEQLNRPTLYKDKREKVKRFLFEGHSQNYADIMSSILASLKLN